MSVRFYWSVKAGFFIARKLVLLRENSPAAFVFRVSFSVRRPKACVNDLELNFSRPRCLIESCKCSNQLQTGGYMLCIMCNKVGGLKDVIASYSSLV